MMKVAVIGCGHIGKRHIEMINRSSDFELAFVCDNNKSLDLSVYGVPYFDSIDTLVEQDFDILTISTPNIYHFLHGLKALENGKHIIIEKPFCLLSSECGQLIKVSQEQGKQIFCVMQNRYSPPAEWLKAILPILGKIYLVQINCYWNRDDRYYTGKDWRGGYKDGGTLYTQFSHFIDMMLWLFGDIDVHSASFRDFNHKDLTLFEDSGIINFNLGEGMGTFNYSTSCYDENLESSITIIAENGSVKVGGQYMNKVDYCHIKGYSMPELAESEPANDYGLYKGSASNHHKVYENVADVLFRYGKITTTPQEEMQVIKTIEHIYSFK